MKIIIIILITFFTSNNLFGQVTYGKEIKAKYSTFSTWSYSQEEYIEDEEISGWMETSILPQKDYYIVNFSEKESKVWWEHSSKSDEIDETDIYITEDKRKVVFNYEFQIIYFFYNFNETYNRYEDLMQISKLEVR